MTVVLYSCIWMYCIRWHPNAYLGIESKTSSQKYSTIVTSVPPGSPAEQAGFRLGDQIVAINGQRLENLEPFYQVLSRGKPGDVVTLSVERSGAPTPLKLYARLNPWPTAQRGSLAEKLAFEMVGAFPVWFVLVSFPVLFLRVEDRNAWLLALLFSGFIAGGPLFPFEFIIPHAIRGFALAYKIIFAGLFSALFNYFFAVFPTSSGLDRRFPWLKTVLLAGAAAVSFPLGLWTLFAGNTSLAIRLGVWTQRHEPLHWLVMVYTFGLLPLGLVSLISNGFFAPSADVRRKIRVIVWGTVAGLFPGMILQIAAVFTGKQVPDLFPVWFWGPLVFGSFWLFPLSFAYAVVKHRVLEIPVLLKRSARFLVVQWGVHILGILLTITLALFLGRAFSRMISEHPEISVIPAIALGGLILWLGIMVGRPVNKRIDRAFFRSSYDARQILEDLADKTRTSTGREQLASLLGNHIQQALHPASLALYLEVSDGRLQLARGNSLSGTKEISAELPLLVELAKRGQPWEVPPNFEERSVSTLMLPKPECLVPILASREGQLLGLLVLGPRLSEETYSREDRRLLASVASQTAGALRSISLAEKIAEQLEVERRTAVEMQVAKEVQDKLLPQSAPVLSTLECAGRCIQTRSVGGDYYDFLELGSHHVGLVLGDVSGKGISAALLMANLQANLRSRCAVSSGDIALQLSSVNHQLWKSSADGYYATLFFADYDDVTRRLVYSNCGHNPPVLLRADGAIERLTATATVLGLFEKWQCLTQETTLHPGDLLAIYSDGVTEAMNHAGEEFGETRFIASLREFRSFAPALLLTNVVSMVQEFAGGFQSDDLTLVIARAF
jgi:sigma-B regulation protein RsbU (phosphoserine phosphatase)